MNTALPFRSVIAALTLTGCFACSMAQRSVAVFCRPGASDSSQAYMWNDTDKAPSFPGGEGAMIRFINNERHYPQEAYDAGVEGRVRCGFVVDVDGSIINITVQRGSHELLNREAVRIISSMPRWEAGTVDGEPVPVYYLLTIPFRL